jgi:hypothetical protein
LSLDDEQFVYQSTRDILDDNLASEPQATPADKASVAGDAGEPAANTMATTVKIFGCAARGEVDELALQMFRQFLELTEHTVQLEIVSGNVLAGEIAVRIREEQPAVVCIAAVPPGGLAQTRYLCKRIRAQAPNQKIIVGRWGGVGEHVDGIRNRLKSLGVDCVATTMIESRSQIAPAIESVACVADKTPVGV